MGKCFLLFLLPVALFGGWLAYFFFLEAPPPLPEFDYDYWWGPKELKGRQDTSIRPFKIVFSDAMIKDLRQRLTNHREWTPPLEGIGFQYGFNTNELKDWVSFWVDKYNFNKQEKFFNKYPQFKTNIQGLDIHFIRVKPQNVPAGVEVIPMLLLHGWPGSVREFYEAIPLLSAVSKDRDFALELIVPSLPGYGFSDAAVRPGLGAAEMAVVFRNLMHRLGHKKYYVQGGDWGSLIGSIMATIFPNEVLGYHTNMAFVMSPKVSLLQVIGSFMPSMIVDSKYASRMYPLGEMFANLLEEMGYFHLQATKPDSIGVALADSPAGLLAYIVEKFSTWTRNEFREKPDGGLSFRFTKEQLIDNLMMYWTSNSMMTAMRLYSETMNKRHHGLQLDRIPTSVPTCIISAKNEIAYLPETLLRFKFTNIVHMTHIEDGGHFLAFELPAALAEDVLKGVKEIRSLKKMKTEL